MSCVLIIEDDDDLREMLKAALSRIDIEVQEAGNGREALKHFKPKATDLVVTDIIMPEEDGLKVIMKMKDLKPGIKIIAISGGGKAGPGSYLQMAKTLGADRVFSKPFSVSDLISEISSLLRLEQND